jgi:hypothetical protein
LLDKRPVLSNAKVRQPRRSYAAPGRAGCDTPMQRAIWRAALTMVHDNLRHTSVVTVPCAYIN